jgi:hypothetical protein
VQTKREKDWDELMADSPVKLRIEYTDKNTKVARLAPISAGAVETPQANDAVAFHLINTDKENAYAVVLKINGENSIEHQTVPPLDCYKWILRPGKEIVVEGFQKGDNSEETFKVLPPESSKGEEINYGDNAGVFSMVVFREAKGKEDQAFVKDDEMRNQDVKAISRGSLSTKASEKPPLSLKALQGQLADEANPAKSSHEGAKGLIVGGGPGHSEITHTDFTPFPRPELSVVLRYYQPHK